MTPSTPSRIKQAVAEIKNVAKTEPLLAAEAAITFFERVSPALEQVDNSSGSIGTAVNNAIAELVPLIDEAYARYGVRANKDGTYLATFRAVAKKIVAAGGTGESFVTKVLGRELEL